MVKVKVCGITNLEDALAATICGADALGFVFSRKSPRYISPAKARNISRIIPKQISKIGVFVNQRPEAVRRIAKLAGLDILQFHGDERVDYCAQFRGFKVVKAFRVGSGSALSRVKDYKTWGYLFDAYSPHVYGGTGKRFDWKQVKQLGRIDRVVFLSGGLDSRNVKGAVKTLHPDWVDVSSGVERRPGKKDFGKIERFIRLARLQGVRSCV
jgi:phosphoribosylanthranilate isomerase